MLVRTGGINPTKSGSKVSRKQFSLPSSPCSASCGFSCCRCLCRCPPSLHSLQRTGAPGCGAGSSAAPDAASVCSSAPSSKLEVVFKKWRRGNPGTDQQGDWIRTVGFSLKTRLCSTETNTTNVTMSIYNKYSSISEMMIGSLMSLATSDVVT